LNVLALVAEGRLTRAQAKNAAAGMWLTGAIPVEDLPVFAAEVQKVWEEREGSAYAYRVAQRPWPEIEKILNSSRMDEAGKEHIREHPEVQRKRQLHKWLSFGASGSRGAASLVFRGPPTSEELEGMRRTWCNAWPQMATYLKLGERVHLQGVIPAAEMTKPSTKGDTWAAEVDGWITAHPKPGGRSKRAVQKPAAARAGKRSRATGRARVGSKGRR
jgi:hypothetical protein